MDKIWERKDFWELDCADFWGGDKYRILDVDGNILMQIDDIHHLKAKFD